MYSKRQKYLWPDHSPNTTEVITGTKKEKKEIIYVCKYVENNSSEGCLAFSMPFLSIIIGNIVIKIACVATF